MTLPKHYKITSPFEDVHVVNVSSDYDGEMLTIAAAESLADAHRMAVVRDSPELAAAEERAEGLAARVAKLEDLVASEAQVKALAAQVADMEVRRLRVDTFADRVARWMRTTARKTWTQYANARGPEGRGADYMSPEAWYASAIAEAARTGERLPGEEEE